MRPVILMASLLMSSTALAGEGGNCATGGSGTDADGDGFCSEETGGIDCNDGDPDVYPGADEVFGSDMDCDGSTCEVSSPDAHFLGTGSYLDPRTMASARSHLLRGMHLGEYDDEGGVYGDPDVDAIDIGDAAGEDPWNAVDGELSNDGSYNQSVGLMVQWDAGELAAAVDALGLHEAFVVTEDGGPDKDDIPSIAEEYDALVAPETLEDVFGDRVYIGSNRTTQGWKWQLMGVGPDCSTGGCTDLPAGADYSVVYIQDDEGSTTLESTDGSYAPLPDVVQAGQADLGSNDDFVDALEWGHTYLNQLAQAGHSDKSVLTRAMFW